MCGLVGVAIKSRSGFMMGDTGLFHDMLYMDTLRGWDSTGIASFHNNGEMRMMKDVGPAVLLQATKEYDELIVDAKKNGVVLLGHNRKSTVGKTSEDTAHPFHIDNRYLFMHNGTLRNHEKIAKTEVDSEALGILLTGCEGDPGKMETALEQVEGAYACVWLDQELEKLYMLRNKERPLYILKGTYGIAYASEWGMLVAAAQRNRWDIPKEGVKQIEEHTLITIDLKEYTQLVKEDKLTVKKSTTPMVTYTGGTAGKANTFSGSSEVSKNLFKKLYKEYVGKELWFYIGDYFTRIADGSRTNDWLITGESEDVTFDHRVQGNMICDEKEFIEVYDTVPVKALVYDMRYDRTEKQVVFMVQDIKEVVH